MAKFYNTFEFIGNAQISNNLDKISSLTQNKTKTWTTLKVMMAIKESTTNSAFLDISAGFQSDGNGKIYTVNKSGEKMEIPFKDRLNPAYADLVADYAKYVVDLETDEDIKAEYISLSFKIMNIYKKLNDGSATDEDKVNIVKYKEDYKSLSVNRHEFISEYDFVKFVEDNLPQIRTLRLKVRGNYSVSLSKGKTYTSYSPKIIEVAKAEEENKLECYLDFYFDRDCLEVEEDALFANGFISCRDSYAKADRFFKTQLVCRNSKFFEVFKGFLTTTENTYQHLTFVCNVYSGANQKEFTYDDLTDQQKAMVDCGMATIDEYKPKGGYVLGNNITELRLAKPLLMGDFASGVVDSGLNDEEFSVLIAKGEAEVANTPELKDAIAGQFGEAAKPVDEPPFTPDVKPTEITPETMDDIFADM